MSFPRFRLSGVLAAVIVLAINLGIIRALYDGPESHLLYLALPTVNTLAAVGYAGLRRPRLRAFAAGFVAAGAASLIGFLAWESDHPWTMIRFLEPFCEAIERLVPPAHPAWTLAVTFAALAVTFWAPHAIVGLASGGLAASGWAIFSRRMRGLRRGARTFAI